MLENVDWDVVSGIANVAVAILAAFISYVLLKSQQRSDRIATHNAYREASNEILWHMLTNNEVHQSFNELLYGADPRDNNNNRTFICSLIILNYLEQALVAADNQGLSKKQMDKVIDTVGRDLMKNPIARSAVNRGTYRQDLASRLTALIDEVDDHECDG